MHIIRALFHHVKGHQKATADQQLTLPEKLNIDCDKQASCMSPASTNSPICANPFLPAGYLHLCINHQCIIQCLQHTLHNATTNGSYYDYLLENLEWSESPEHTIHWPMICLALKHFKAVKHQTVTKFIHKWLPLQDHHHVQSTSKFHLCLSCHQAPENNNHFFACPHLDWQQIWKALHNLLHKHQITHGFSNMFHNILAFGFIKVAKLLPT